MCFLSRRRLRSVEPIQVSQTKPVTPFNAIMDSSNLFSTGLVDLDKILSGGYSTAMQSS